MSLLVGSSENCNADKVDPKPFLTCHWIFCMRIIAEAWLGRSTQAVVHEPESSLPKAPTKRVGLSFAFEWADGDSTNYSEFSESVSLQTKYLH